MRDRPHQQVFKLEYGKITAIDNNVPDWAIKAYEKQLTDYLGLDQANKISNTNEDLTMSNTKEKLDSSITLDCWLMIFNLNIEKQLLLIIERILLNM